ncbi:MAG: enoyl-CoA hydratase/isomerase family protein [Deltaproteobacteria bacterium]|nr:enoyl-CoA hydratase/isomerase family protein [Deltaproteobacteria bacterium]
MDTKRDKGTDFGGEVFLEIIGGVATIRLGSTDKSVFTLKEDSLSSLEKAIAAISEAKDVRGLIIVGRNENIFCAGADINLIKEISDRKLATQLAQRGQAVFDKLDALSCVTIAAISGACVGGGCELVLACDYRIASDSIVTKIGLPEIKLGILPGFGGTQRLPRLIGLPAALDIILKGSVVSADKAVQLGLVDFLVRNEARGANQRGMLELLEEKAAEIILGKKRIARRPLSVRDKLLTHSGLGRALVAKKARQQVLTSTKGHYPAPLLALDVALFGLRAGMTVGLKREAEKLGELLVTPESKSLVHVYMLTDEASKRWRSSKLQLNNSHVAVIGAGTMGAGIAASMVMSGLRVTVVEPISEVRARAASLIEGIVGKRHKHRVAAVLSNLQLVENVRNLSNVDIVVEAVSEKFELKKKIFEELDRTLDSKAILASNTSSLPISDFSADVSHRGRIVGMHFFNPVEKMPLVEVVCTKHTDERTIAFTSALAVSMGKYPVIVSEVPGFLVNRILTPYLVEAAFLLKEGFGIAEIDELATSFGMPMGPFRLLDEIGLDVAAEVSGIIEDSYGSRMSGPHYVAKLLAAGRKGKKGGKGFYLYEDGNKAVLDNSVRGVLEVSAPVAIDRQKRAALTDRLILRLLNEAVMCLDEEVAGLAGPEAAGQIDLATVMGLGFAPFRGGILHYANTVGAKVILEKLTNLEREHGERFTPCSGIAARAKKRKTFLESVA